MSATKPTLKALQTLFGDKAPEAASIFDAPKVALVDLLTPSMPYADKLGIHELRLEALGLMLDGSHGVEWAELHRAKGQRAVIRYINTGDTYSPTVCRVYTEHDSRISYRVTTWGDEVERLQRLGYY